MKIEIATGYRVNEIAYAAGVLIDELEATKVRGLDAWFILKDTWIDHIRGKRPHSFDLTAVGLTLAYRGYFHNIERMNVHGLSIIFDEPRLELVTDDKRLELGQQEDIRGIVKNFSESFDLVKREPPSTLIFPKIIYASNIVEYDTDIHNLG